MQRAINEGNSEPTQAQQFQAFYIKNYAIILSYFRARGLQKQESQDLAQETFLKSFKYFKSNNMQQITLPWLLRVADSVRKNWLRDKFTLKRNAKEQSLEMLGEESGRFSETSAARDEQSPLQHVILRELLVKVESIVEQFPPQMKRCFMMRFVQDRKYLEIAGIMNINIDTVKAHINQARKKIKDHCNLSDSGGRGSP